MLVDELYSRCLRNRSPSLSSTSSRTTLRHCGTYFLLLIMYFINVDVSLLKMLFPLICQKNKKQKQHRINLVNDSKNVSSGKITEQLESEINETCHQNTIKMIKHKHFCSLIWSMVIRLYVNKSFIKPVPDAFPSPR